MTMIPSRRAAALARLEELMNRMHSTATGSESLQRSILNQLGVAAHNAGVAVGDWLQEYYTTKFGASLAGGPCTTGNAGSHGKKGACVYSPAPVVKEAPAAPAPQELPLSGLECPKCGRVFYSPAALRGHQKKHRYE